MVDKRKKTKREPRKVRVVFESEQQVDLPSKVLTQEEALKLGLNEGDEVYYLRKEDGEEILGRPGEYGIIATFDLNFKSKLLVYDFESRIRLQFMSGNRFVNALGDYADFYQAYDLLRSNFNTKFRVSGIDFFNNELRKKYEQWRWQPWVLIAQFENDPEKTLAFVKANLPQLVTVINLRRIPESFNQRSMFLDLSSVQEGGDFFS